MKGVISAANGASGDYSSPVKQQLEKMSQGSLSLHFDAIEPVKMCICLDVALESTDIAKAITESYAHKAANETLGTLPSAKKQEAQAITNKRETRFYLNDKCLMILLTPMVLLYRKFKADVPSTVSRGAHDFSTVYAVSKGKDGMESEMRSLNLELKQTIEMYSEACREALSAKQKKKKERLEEARFSEEAALSITEQERARVQRKAIEAAEGS
ncbi:hypothetical protein NC652_018325 [Populus alba x Populus x berolinensis]|nr:hypothetical protein NC652_018325 [Populus alba x Populus x berolinensis]